MNFLVIIIAILALFSLGVLIDTALCRAAVDEHDDYDPLTRRLLCDAEWARILASVEREAS